jgi:hypothetical protein
VTTDDGNYAVYAVVQVRNADPSKEAANEKTARKRRAEMQHGQATFSRTSTNDVRGATTEDRQERKKLFRVGRAAYFALR